ncbi:MAG TPA: hypothetical protein VKY39_02925 [Aggregatilineales bacterium]|nr:hypothetical protein [Aggregatilineales bacterium]
MVRPRPVPGRAARRPAGGGPPAPWPEPGPPALPEAPARLEPPEPPEPQAPPGVTRATSTVGAGQLAMVSPSQHSAWLTPYIGQPERTQAA